MALNIVCYFGVIVAGASYCYYYVEKVDSSSVQNIHDSIGHLMTFEMKMMMMWVVVIAFVVARANFVPNCLTKSRRSCCFHYFY